MGVTIDIKPYEPLGACDGWELFPCIDANGRILSNLFDSRNNSLLVLRDGAWWQSLSVPISATSGAAGAWKRFMDFCLDCPKNDAHCYSAWGCVWSALATVWSTAWAFWKWGEFVATVAKRDLDDNHFQLLYLLGPMSLYYNSSSTIYEKRDGHHAITNMTVQLNGDNVYHIDATWDHESINLVLNHHPEMIERSKNRSPDSPHAKRDYTDYNNAISNGGGLKSNYCAVHPDHDLTERYDWDGIWASAARDGPNLANYYYSDIGVVDMNDYVNGGWRMLIGTGKMVEEQSTNFGNNFEGCDRSAFEQLAR